MASLAQLGFKHCATAVLKSNLILSIEFGTAVAQRLKWALVTFCLCIYLMKPLIIKVILNKMTHFLNLMCVHLSIFKSVLHYVALYLNFLTPKILKMGDPILVTPIKMQPHNSQSSRENATPSSGT